MTMDTHMLHRNKGFKTWLTATLLAALLAAGLSAPALAGVRAQLDRNTVFEGDPVILIIESDGQHSGEPDLAPLNRDFKVLGNSTSTRVSIINGRRSDKTSWTVQLEPRHKGKLTIPPVRVGSEQTRALELEVTAIPEHVADRQSRHVFIEVEVDTDGESQYVQQQIPYTIRLYYDENVLSGELEGPQPESAVVEQLGADKHYEVTRNGRLYNVIERHYAIAPEKSGQLQIPPASFRGQVASARSASAPGARQGSFMERFLRNTPFANDPFFSAAPFSTAGQPVRIRSKAITVDILPRPASAGNTWLPAEQLTLHDSWADTPPELRAGEPVTRTLTLQAKGLTGAQLSGLQLEQPAHTRLYPESPVTESRTDGDQVYGISTQNFTYIPAQAGTLTIPAVKLDWWNTSTNQAASTRLPQWEVEVKPGVGGTQTRPPGIAADSMRAATAEQPPPDTQTPPVNRLEQRERFEYWPLAGAALLVLALVLSAVKWRRHTQPVTPAASPVIPAAQNTRAMLKKLLPQLEHACSTNDAKAAAHVLLELGRARWPNDPPRSLGALATRLGQGNEQIAALNRALYAADTAKWNGTGLCIALKGAWQPKPADKKPVKESLKPLYPHSG
ncbi:MAG: BatD family protein [Gammaproteobacteria bacterium]